MFSALRNVPSLIESTYYLPRVDSTIPAITPSDSFRTAARHLQIAPKKLHLFDAALARQSRSVSQMLSFFAQFEETPGNFYFSESEAEESFPLVDILANTYTETLVSLIERKMLAIVDVQIEDPALGQTVSPAEVVGGVLLTQKAVDHYLSRQSNETTDLAVSNLFRSFQNTTLGMNKLYGLIQNEEYTLDWPRNYLLERCHGIPSRADC